MEENKKKRIGIVIFAVLLLLMIISVNSSSLDKYNYIKIQNITSYLSTFNSSCVNCTIIHNHYNITLNLTNNITNNITYHTTNNITNNITHVTNITNNITITHNHNYYITNNITNNITVYLNTTLYQNITINETLNWSNDYGRTLRTLENLHSNSDGFKLVYNTNFEALFDDWLIWYKTDGNDYYPDGGIAIGMSNTTRNWTTVWFYGNGSSKFLHNVTAEYFKGYLDWNYLFNIPYYLNRTASSYLYNSNKSIYFNETKNNNTISLKIASALSTITYYPKKNQTIYGTPTTTDIKLLNLSDNRFFNISENSGANPLDYRVNFTNVSSFNYLNIREQYTGTSGHEIDVELYNYATSLWDVHYAITDQASQQEYSIYIDDNTNHVSAGKVQLRFLHLGTGISSHRLRIDKTTLIQSISGTVTLEHDSLSGRDNICTNHPQVCLNFYNRTQSNSTYLKKTGDTGTGNYIFNGNSKHL